MNLIDGSFETSGQPWRAQADVDFIQRNIADCIQGLIESKIGQLNYSRSKYYVIYGCQVSSVGGMTTVSGGFILLPTLIPSNSSLGTINELIEVSGATFADPTGGNVIIATLNTVPDATWDPTGFFDASSHNIHWTRYLTFGAGGTGTGFVDYTSLVFTTPTIEGRNTLNGDTVTFERDRTIIYNGVGTGAISATLSFTNATIGIEVVIFSVLSSATGLTLSGASIIQTALSSSTVVGASVLNIKLRYLGNFGGTDFVERTFYAA